MMQALPISNLLPAIASTPAVAALLPFDPQLPSPFTAVFQSVLKGAGNSAKVLPAGKSQDSSREPAATTGTGNNLVNLLPQEIAAAALPPILPNVLNLPEPSLSPANSPTRAALAYPDRASQAQPQALPNYFSAVATTGLGTDKAQVSDPSRNFNAATAIPLNPLEPQPALMSSGAVSQDTAASSIAAQDASPTPNVASNSNVPAAPVQAAPIAPAADSSLIPTASALSPIPDGSIHPLSGSPPQLQVIPTNGWNPPNGKVAEAIRADLSFLSMQALAPASEGTKASVSFTPPAAANPVVPSNPQPLTAAGAALSTSVAVATLPAENPVVPSNAQPLTAASAALSPSVAVATLPAANRVVPSNAQPLTAASAALSPSVAVASPPAANRVVPSNAQPLTAAGVALSPSVAVATLPVANPAVQTNPQSLTSMSSTLPETLARSAAKSAAMGASTIKFRENSQAPMANPAPPVPVTAVPNKTQSQDSSNASSGNESNPKPERASNVHGNEKGFVQALDPAAPEPVSGHSAAADSAAVVAAAPVQTQAANSGPAPATTGGADPRPTETLPGAPQNAPVVHAARIVDQPGQTEIRIKMQADSLGGVELRAHIAGDQIGASIAVEHHDVQIALAADLPALHNALIEKNLRVETLSVSHGTFSSLNEGPGQDSSHRDFAHSPAKFAYLEQPVTPESFTDAPPEWAGAPTSSAGLSVVA
jgi:flagellar hook-length control protein FliK